MEKISKNITFWTLNLKIVAGAVRRAINVSERRNLWAKINETSKLLKFHRTLVGKLLALFVKTA